MWKRLSFNSGTGRYVISPKDIKRLGIDPVGLPGRLMVFIWQPQNTCLGPVFLHFKTNGTYTPSPESFLSNHAATAQHPHVVVLAMFLYPNNHIFLWVISNMFTICWILLVLNLCMYTYNYIILNMWIPFISFIYTYIYIQIIYMFRLSPLSSTAYPLEISFHGQVATKSFGTRSWWLPQQSSRFFFEEWSDVGVRKFPY